MGDDKGILLAGLDGSNPLAFLAALGTLRTLDHLARTGDAPDWLGRTVCLSWRLDRGAWRPFIHLKLSPEPDDFVAALHHQIRVFADKSPHLQLGKNLSVPPSEFREHANDAAGQTKANTDRRWADFVASFGSEALKHETLDRIDYTELCFTFGSGHQHYLETIDKLLKSVEPQHLHKSLLRPWDYSDPRLSLRWDPADAREHAYQWTAPSNEVTMTMWGANLLAAEGAAFFTCCPDVRRKKGTVGVRGSGSRASFSWPIWSPPLGVDVVRALLAQRDLVNDGQNRLRERGVMAVYRAAKVKIGEGANFKWSFSPATCV